MTTTVLMLGPDTAAIGGMGSVAQVLARGANAGDAFHVDLARSGGGHGPKGWVAWPGALLRVIRSHHDVVHLHVAMKGSTVRKATFALAARLTGKPYVIHLHGSRYAIFLDSLHGLPLWLVQRFFRGASTVVTLGDSWRDLVLDRLHTDPERTVVIGNGVPAITPTQREDTIAFLGELSHRKGVDVLLEAVEPVLAAHPGWRLELVGPTPDEQIVEQARQASARVGGRIVLVGPKFGDDKLPYLEHARLFVLPSRNEGLPMAMLEAMAADVCVVMTPVGAIDEVIHDGVNGRLVPVEDAAALEAVLDELVVDAPQRERLAAAGHAEWERHHSEEHMLSAMEDVWRRAAAEGVRR